MNERKVIRRRSYTIIHETYDDGQEAIERINDGLNAFELLGLLDMTSRDIVEQIKHSNDSKEGVHRSDIERSWSVNNFVK